MRCGKGGIGPLITGAGVNPLEVVDFSRLRSLIFTVEAADIVGARLFELPALGGMYVDGVFEGFPMMKRKSQKRYLKKEKEDLKKINGN